MEADQAVRDARSGQLLKTGQKIFARIRRSSKYYGQGREGELFPVVISEVGSVWKIHELELGVSFEIDLLHRHALIPKKIALQFLQDQNVSKVADWVERQWDLFPNNPVLAWKAEEISRPRN